ncbi:hypothetical protein AOLI_G00179210 [Acnodon oligacanthus]
MEPKHKEILRAQRLQLSEQLVVDDTVIQYLYQEGILTESQVEEIQSQPSNRNKTLRLLAILPGRGPLAFGAFLRSLEQDFPWVREKLLLLSAATDDSATLSDPSAASGGLKGRAEVVSTEPEKHPEVKPDSTTHGFSFHSPLVSPGEEKENAS